MQAYAKNNDDNDSNSSSGSESENSDHKYVPYFTASISNIEYKVHMGSKKESICSKIEEDLIFCQEDNVLDISDASDASGISIILLTLVLLH